MQSRAVMLAYGADAYLWPIIEGFVMLAILAVPVLGIVLLVRAAQRFHPARPLQAQARQHERGQGRVAGGEILHALSLPAPVSQGGIAIAHGLPSPISTAYRSACRGKATPDTSPSSARRAQGNPST